MIAEGTVYRLKVTLRWVKPPVWRRIVVPSDMRLSDLAPVLEAAMGWLGGHLHLFEADGARYTMPDPEWPDDDLDESQFRLGEVLSSPGAGLRWDYDFGDGWEHDVVVEAIDPADPSIEYPICLTGKRACPPEDCGGVPGYENLFAALADPGNPDHQELLEWAPPGFDPELFDLAETDTALRSPRPLFGW